MDAKEILNPKWLLIGVGSLLFLASLSGVMDGQSWAESGWGKENVAEHDAEYEQMWALHLMPLAVMSIATGLIVSGRALAQMAMAAAVSIAVFIGGGMLYLTNESGYGSDQSGMIYVMLFLTALIGASGYLNKDDE
mgnify:FL=1